MENRIIDYLDRGCSPELIADLMHIPVRWIARYVDVQKDADEYADADAEEYGNA